MVQCKQCKYYCDYLTYHSDGDLCNWFGFCYNNESKNAWSVHWILVANYQDRECERFEQADHVFNWGKEIVSPQT
jgi:hypothetical protein